MRPLVHLSWLLPSIALAAACSSDDDGGGGSTTTSPTTSTSTTTSGSGGAGGSGGAAGGGEVECRYELGVGESCEEVGYELPTEQSTVESVSATISDLDGNPVEGLLVDLCDLTRCYDGTTDANGDVMITTGGYEFTGVRMLYGNGVGSVRLFAELPATPIGEFGDIRVALLPTTGADFVLGGEATSGDVTLGLDEAAFVEFNAIIYCTEEEEAFRAVTIPTDGSVNVPALAAGNGFEMAFGLAPIDTTICPPAKMTVPNGPGWDANAEVEFWYQGTSPARDYAPFGEWALVSDGVVSADGLTVTTNDDEGIPELGVVAIRLKP